jgi:GntR family transcriptional regulator
MSSFNDTQPIFLQISERIAEMILSNAARDGEALPSVRQISADLRVNPLTVTRAYQSLVDIGVVESRRGMGMYVQPGARDRLLAHEREKFLTTEWPRILQRLSALELDPIQLLQSPGGTAQPSEGSDNE